jgi:hypothetical protein
MPAQVMASTDEPVEAFLLRTEGEDAAMPPPPDESAAPRDKAGYELHLALRHPGCPICRLTNQAVARYLESTSYENVNDLSVREELRAAQGWCAVHAARWLEQLDALGTAIIYKDVLDTARRALREARPVPAAAEAAPDLLGKLRGLVGSGSAPHPGSAIAEALEPTGTCPACAQMRTSERHYLGAFSGALASPAFLVAYRPHPTGICLPHLRAVLRGLPDPALVAALVEAQAAILARTSAALAEVIRKNDYRFRQEPRGDEFRVPAWAVEQAAGSVPNTTGEPR